MAEVALALFWPALIGYAEAAAAYVADTLRPGRLARPAIWGVRLGWLAQTALLVAQAAGSRGFPWGSWAGSLNLFVWMCVGGYLIWGCRAPFRLLGLSVMPLAALLFAVAGAAGGDRLVHGSRFGTAFLALHVGLVVAAFAAFTVAAGLAAVYLWQDRGLKHHSPSLLRVWAPSLDGLDRLIGRMVAAGLAALTAGVGVGLARARSEGVGFDAVMAFTFAAWVVYAALLVLRYEAGWRGRRAAYTALGGFAAVIVVRLAAVPFGHF